ncbi:MAG TPA: DUF4013 domain-containing protein [Candidatus Krumholzibacteria bacterium]|nr:DUF4013 domain-containing protein [Candidatus Krumholzibacteria bacterium]
MTTDTLYFVLRDGSTREEQWSWEDIEALCRSGDLTPGARIFLPDEERWALISETRLVDACRVPGATAAGPDAQHDPDREALETAYQEALARAGEDDSLEALLDAGILAAQLDRPGETREHLQKVLHRYPYHARAAQEVKRRFSAAEQRTFRYLERPIPVWEDLGAAAAMPLQRGPLYFLIPAAVFAALGYVPGGGFVQTAIAFLWTFQIMEYTARGATRPPEWNRALKDPLRKIVRPTLLMAAVSLQWVLVLGGVAFAAKRASGESGESLLGYVSGSPVFVVVASIIGVLYLPAAVVSIGGFVGSVEKTLDPRRLFRMVARMEHEYVYSVAIIGLLAAAVAITHGVTAPIPVAGRIVTAMVLAYAVPVCGLTLGRLLGRTGHVIE